MHNGHKVEEQRLSQPTGWIGVDLDGTLAIYNGWQGAAEIGEPIPLMVERVKRWLDAGLVVKIFTARVWAPMGNDKDALDRQTEAIKAFGAIKRWCMAVFGQELPVTCTKDYGMIELWDDRAIQVEKNTGRIHQLPIGELQ